MIEHGMLVVLAHTLKEYMQSGAYADNFDSKELADIVVGHAAAAGLAAMAVGVLPGLGALIASGIAVGAIWTMYVRIGKYLHLSLSKDFWKAIASAVATNIITQLAGVLVLELAVGFIPGASIIAAGVVNFGITYVAGLIFLYALTEIFSCGGDLENMTHEEIKERFGNAAQSVNVSDAFSEAKDTFQQMRKDGSLEEWGKDIDIEG